MTTTGFAGGGLLVQPSAALATAQAPYPAELNAIPGARIAQRGISIDANGVVHVSYVATWERRIIRRIPRATVYHLDLSNPARRARIVAPGRDGERVTVITFVERDGGPIHRRAVSYVARAPHPRVIDDGLGPYGAYGDFDHHTISRFGFTARSEVRMVATAYTPHCYGCSGITATGRPAGPGIVAVDPRVIPLGSRLYIPGYGFAIAGDTGGDIQGDRVDLGFLSYDTAVRFGRREVIVYTLK
ncbi:MAG TPA: 3D domain-containing protein [Candidatus Tyrphobacter sp.]